MMVHSRTDNPIEKEDISFLMKKRAKGGYGIPAVMKDEKKLREVLQDPVLLERWSWLKRIFSIHNSLFDISLDIFLDNLVICLIFHSIFHAFVTRDHKTEQR